ncbi:ribosome biogenesis GTPase [Granulicatella balaenopterae]|uniref:Small ribosomal subunit biogenesis GTPase RsgA n=1 Tax=Granulicatella balaenopterae TaxID=137733 RepID=A0A1H9KKB5_9LACT|nr:ribosome small subunit-dependent GTPase A [Granulicatella balaenopterae]SEQ99542.1 ribosome biogenesis GTPase [Granulicatella balaenopterae]
MPKGQIVKALSGFYYIESEGIVYQTRGRGVFRKKKITPLVGDYVEFDTTSLTDGTVTKILPRKNDLVRPPVANVDCAVIVMSAIEPDFSTYLVDRFLIYLELKDIRPIIYISKMDLVDEQQMADIKACATAYEALGYRVYLSHEFEQEAFLADLSDELVVFMGQSGVGKSTLINHFIPELSLETAEISSHLGRGRHTTRHVALHKVKDVLIADTPGFSTLDLIDIDKENLPYLFPEFANRAHLCKFRECSHQHEPKCAVKDALENGEIAQFRYDHYTSFLEEIEQTKPKYNKK